MHEVKLYRGAPKVSHLFFANDYVMFCKANISKVRHLMEILRVYTKLLGREINMTTSEVFFSHNISRLTQDDLSRLMGVHHMLGT